MYQIHLVMTNSKLRQSKNMSNWQMCTQVLALFEHGLIHYNGTFRPSIFWRSYMPLIDTGHFYYPCLTQCLFCKPILRSRIQDLSLFGLCIEGCTHWEISGMFQPYPYSYWQYHLTIFAFLIPKWCKYPILGSKTNRGDIRLDFKTFFGRIWRHQKDILKLMDL